MEEWTRPSIDLRRTWGIGHKPWVVNVSNHNPLKNHRDFFRLANKLKEIGAHFTLIGGSHPMNKWALGRMGISGGCAYECSFRSALSMGAMDLKMHLPRNQVVSVIKEADVVVSTSRWEANSVVLLESMAAGTPWVSFDVGSASENSGGVVANNLDAMANVVAELLRDGNRRKCLGRSGRARAIANHDWGSLRISMNNYIQIWSGMNFGHVQASSDIKLGLVSRNLVPVIFAIDRDRTLSTGSRMARAIATSSQATTRPTIRSRKQVTDFH